jgi:anaerobic ribonucleoside-triphosphate reductase
MRQTSTQKRLELMSGFSQELIDQSRHTLAQRMPQPEANLEWVKANYGADIANRLRKYFDGIAENHQTSH